MSFLSNDVKRTSRLLRLGAEDRVLEYERRLASVKGLYERLLSDFIVSGFSFEQAYETALKFFGSHKVRFAGIDGTLYSNPLYDLMIFFGGAYAATGTVTFRRDSEPRVDYDSKFLKSGVSLSSVVPIYINEVPEIDQTFFDLDESGELTPSRPLIDQAIVNNATIANWIMTFAEYYLAYRLASDKAKNIRIILMDRTLSGERAGLLYDTSRRELWKVKSNLLGIEVDGVPIDKKDLDYGRYCIRNSKLGVPPPRGDFLRYAIIFLIQEAGPLTLDEICERLEVKDEKRRKRVERLLRASVKEEYLVLRGDKYEANPRYMDTWDRLKKLVRKLGDRFFFHEGEEGFNVMKVVKGGRESWLTTLDIAFLSLFCLEMLIEECWRRRILLIGLTKDTAARDFKRQLIPILNNEGLLRGSIEPEELEDLPNTDRMILQSASVQNPDKFKVPWCTVEYDTCFKTMVPDKKLRKGYIRGARKNRISLEKVFLKSYVQLSQANRDPLLRSNVLLTERLVHPDFDFKDEAVMRFWNEFSSAKEPVEAIIFKNRSIENSLQNMVMVLLKSMTAPSIPEAFGHNKPLFIADKVAKWHYSTFKRIVDSAKDWILNNRRLRRFVFYMSTFRERRARIEAARREVL
ncbi:hypothetical protein J7L06_03310 [Candidatus Bathyarchaeota archaeon]|nr:hypothetical protein [Candidatus Bathyarchaeota archaeon]